MSSNNEFGDEVSSFSSVWTMTSTSKNWLELPTDVTADILQRIGVVDILENAQKVCTVWREICKDPAMWRVIYMDTSLGQLDRSLVCWEMCKQAVDRSQGQLVDLTVIDFFHDELLQYVADRSSQLKRLEIVDAFDTMCGHWSEALKKLSSLEELSLFRTEVSKEDIEAVGRYCPLLKTLKLNQQVLVGYSDDDEIALAIGKNLPELTHLELIGNRMENVGLQAILDGCCHLESLDLRRCLFVNLEGRLGTRCSQQIKHLKLPHDSLKGCPYIHGTYDYDDSDDYNDYGDYDDYYGYDDNDDYDYYGDDDFELAWAFSLNEI